MTKGGMIRPKVEGCVWVLSKNIANFLTYGNEFLSRVNVYMCTRCIGALSMHFIFATVREIKREKGGKKRKAHDIPSAFPAFSRFIIAFVHLFRAEGKSIWHFTFAPCS